MGEFEILDTDEPLAKRIERHAFDRLIMLSDGVFAIAITLLALEIKPPAGLGPGGPGLLSALGPSLGGFAVSFFVTSAYWTTHRHIFARLRRVDGLSTVITLLLLALVVLQPLALEAVMAYGPRGEALLFYVGLIGAIAVAQSLLWGYAALVANLVDPSLPRSYCIARLLIGLIAPLVACGLTLYAANRGSPFALGVVAVVMLLTRVGRRFILRRFEPR